MLHKDKYLKYKNKYLNLKSQLGGQRICKIAELGLNRLLGDCDNVHDGYWEGNEISSMYMCPDHSQMTQCRGDTCYTRDLNGSGTRIEFIRINDNWHLKKIEY